MTPGTSRTLRHHNRSDLLERRFPPLAAAVSWILLQTWAGEFHDEIRGLWGLLRRANGHAAPVRKVHRLQAPCPSCQVRTLTHRPGAAAVTCENCGHTQTLPEMMSA